MNVPERPTPMSARYAYGFLGSSALEVYIALVRRRLGGGRLPKLPVDPPPTLCTAWGGFGAALILAQLRSGRVPDALWQRFARAVRRTASHDFYNGVAGALPVLALVAGGRSNGPSIVRQAMLRVSGDLCDTLDAVRGSTNLGLAHGLAGRLLAYEIGCVLLAEDGQRLRRRAIRLLVRSALKGADGAYWPSRTGGRTISIHGVCNGGPGVALSALVGFRYSGDVAYAPLVELAAPTLATYSTLETFCCGTIGRVEVLIEAFRTTEDATFLKLARELRARIDERTLTGPTWQEGRAGLSLVDLRLQHPTEVDLPGLPLALEPLDRS